MFEDADNELKFYRIWEGEITKVKTRGPKLFANKPLANMPCRNKFSFATSDYLTAGRLIYQLCRGANRGNAEQNRKGTGGNQVLRMTLPH